MKSPCARLSHDHSTVPYIMPVNPDRKKPLVREIPSRSPFPSMPSTPAGKQPECLRDLDFENELKSAVNNILHACTKYASFIVYTRSIYL